MIKGKSILTSGEYVHDIYELAVACSNQGCTTVSMYPVSLSLCSAHFPSMQARVMLTKMQRFALGPQDGDKRLVNRFFCLTYASNPARRKLQNAHLTSPWRLVLRFGI
jgi:hypothetical protein